MCWSLEASIISAVVEFVLIGGITIRAVRSSNPYVRGQLWLLPILLSIATIEAIEALLWMDEDMVSITESSNNSCSRWNRNLTLTIFLGLMPWQPFTILAGTRRTGDKRNRDLLLAPELLALFYAMTFVGTYLVTSLPFLRQDYFADKLPLRSLESTNYTSCFHTTTCTYIGLHGRLHWALASPDAYSTPNTFACTMLWLAVAVARPLRLSAGLWLSLWAWMVFLLLFPLEMTFESGSVWCWSGIAASIYVVLQPYVLPCRQVVTDDISLKKKK